MRLLFVALVVIVSLIGNVDAQCLARTGIRDDPRSQAAANGARCNQAATHPAGAGARRCQAHETICDKRHNDYHVQCNKPRGCNPPVLIDKRWVCNAGAGAVPAWNVMRAAGVNPPGPIPAWPHGDCLRFLEYQAATWENYAAGIQARIDAGELCLEMRQKWDHDCDFPNTLSGVHGPEKAAVTAALVQCRAQLLTAPGIAAGHRATVVAAGAGVAPLVMMQSEAEDNTVAHAFKTRKQQRQQQQQHTLEQRDV